jgi:hypothetical protein
MLSLRYFRAGGNEKGSHVSPDEVCLGCAGVASHEAAKCRQRMSRSGSSQIDDCCILNVQIAMSETTLGHDMVRPLSVGFEVWHPVLVHYSSVYIL